MAMLWSGSARLGSSGPSASRRTSSASAISGRPWSYSPFDRYTSPIVSSRRARTSGWSLSSVRMRVAPSFSRSSAETSLALRDAAVEPLKRLAMKSDTCRAAAASWLARAASRLARDASRLRATRPAASARTARVTAPTAALWRRTNLPVR
jgi:hypothetical protein